MEELLEDEYDTNNDETFFDLPPPVFHDDDDGGDDLETFGDIGPFNDDWQSNHDKFAELLERERIQGGSQSSAKGEEDFFGNLPQAPAPSQLPTPSLQMLQSQPPPQPAQTHVQQHHETQPQHHFQPQQPVIGEPVSTIAQLNLSQQPTSSSDEGDLAKWFSAIQVNNAAPPPPSNKILSLAEIEAQMQAQSSVAPSVVQQQAQPQPQHSQQPQSQQPIYPQRQQYQNQNQYQHQQYQPYRNQGPPHYNSNYPYMRRWKESKKMMTADEIESIIRVQHQQLYTENPYIEDFYYQSFIKKSQAAPQPATHKPICESTPRAPRKQIDPLPNVLGRIPSHSVRAPRPLVQVKDKDATTKTTEDIPPEQQDQEKAISYAIAQTIEDMFNIVLETEDLQILINSYSNPNPSDENYQNLYTKRMAFTADIFKLLNVYIPTSNAGPEDHLLQDNILLKMLLVTKGRKLIARLIPLLLMDQFQFLFMFFMRNLSFLLQILSQSVMDGEDEKVTESLFYILTVQISHLSLPQLTYGLDNLIYYHSTLWLELLQNDTALIIITKILQTADSITKRDREDSFITQWYSVFDVLLQRIVEHIPILHAYNPHASESRAFNGFKNVLYSSVDEGQKPKILKLLTTDWNKLNDPAAVGSPKRPPF